MVVGWSNCPIQQVVPLDTPGSGSPELLEDTVFIDVFYSVRRAFTGLAEAARTACQLAASAATSNARPAAAR